MSGEPGEGAARGAPIGPRGTVTGVTVAVVTDDRDPEGLCRVKVRCPRLGANGEGGWAPVVVPMAGDRRGAFFVPQVGDEVLVAFEQGDPRAPYVLGALWDGSAPPPSTGPGGERPASRAAPSPSRPKGRATSRRARR